MRPKRMNQIGNVKIKCLEGISHTLT